jgi:hypothetical protein
MSSCWIWASSGFLLLRWGEICFCRTGSMSITQIHE